MMGWFSNLEKLASVLVLGLVVSAAGITAPAQQASATLPASKSTTTLTREDRIRLFEQVWRAVSDNYYDKNFKGVDWRGLREYYRPQAESASNSEDLYRVLRQMVGRLGDAHTRIYSPEDGFDRFRPTGTTIGLTVRRIESRSIVTWIDPVSEAYRKGVRPGFTVALIDGQPVDKLIDLIRSDIGLSSTQTALELQSYDRLFHGLRDTQVAVTFLDNDGNSMPLSLSRRYVEFQRRVNVRMLPYKIGYIEITGFGPEIEKEFEYAMQFVQGSRGLIIDLRNNGGGFVTTVAQVASYFFNEETDLGEFITRQGRSTRRRTMPLRQVYREPVALLVSSRSASGAEILAATMQERKRGFILGTNPSTCGCLLGVSRTLKLLDGGKLNVSDTDFRTPLGKRIEGTGVRPDLLVDLKASDILAGRDRPLESAVDQLGRTIAFGSRNSNMDFKLKVPQLKSSASSPYTSTSTSQFRRE